MVIKLSRYFLSFLIEVSKELEIEYMKKFIGKKVSVLIEENIDE